MRSSSISVEPDAPGGACLLVSELAVSFEGRYALRGVNLSLQSGDSVALIGPNGAGKTTLLRAVLGLVPFSGQLSVLGKSATKARSKVAYVAQGDGFDTDFPVSALQVVLMGRYRHVGWFRRPGRTDRIIAEDALSRVGLGELGARRFGTLSGGQRQRVLLARAIAQQAELLLLDEPFNGVDVTSIEIIVEVMAALRAGGAGMVVSTHDFAIARRIASHVCLLNTDQQAFGKSDEMLTSALLRKTFAGQLLDTSDGSALIIPSHH